MENFLIVLSQIVEGGEKDLVKYATQAAKFFQKIRKFFSLKKLAVIGNANINRANLISKEGLNFFNKGLYTEAAINLKAQHLLIR